MHVTSAFVQCAANRSCVTLLNNMVYKISNTLKVAYATYDVRT